MFILDVIFFLFKAVWFLVKMTAKTIWYLTLMMFIPAMIIGCIVIGTMDDMP